MNDGSSNYEYQKKIVAKEIFRKSIHLCASFVPFLLHIAYTPILALLIAAAIFYTVCEILRMKQINVPLVSQVTEFASRERDEGKFVAGPLTLVVGIIAAAIIFDEEAMRIGIYALAFGDGLASLGGKLFGRRKIPFTHGKTIAGSLVCFAAVFVSSFFVCRNIKYALILSVSAMFIEMLPLADFDNIIIPVAIGAIAQFALGI